MEVRSKEDFFPPLYSDLRDMKEKNISSEMAARKVASSEKARF